MKLNKLILNDKNPRYIKDDKFKKLVNSIKDFPKMLELRPIIVDDNNVILGGNMRYRALQSLNYIDIPDEWVKKANDLTEDEKKEFLIKDNVGFGDWDFDVLANEWDENLLNDWGLDIPNFEVESNEEKEPAKTDLIENYKYHVSNYLNLNYITIFKKSKEGIELKKIKEPEYFDRMVFYLNNLIKNHIKNKNTCLICPPARRHKDWNLAQQLVIHIAEKNSYNYDIDLFEAKNLQKIDPQIWLKKELIYDNYILIDDIVTTGSTIKACGDLLENKNFMCFVLIANQ